MMALFHGIFFRHKMCQQRCINSVRWKSFFCPLYTGFYVVPATHQVQRDASYTADSFTYEAFGIHLQLYPGHITKFPVSMSPGTNDVSAKVRFYISHGVQHPIQVSPVRSPAALLPCLFPPKPGGRDRLAIAAPSDLPAVFHKIMLTVPSRSILLPRPGYS